MVKYSRFALSILLTAVVLISPLAFADQCQDLLVSPSIQSSVSVEDLSVWRRLALKYEMLKAHLILRGNRFRTNRPLRNSTRGGLSATSPGSYESYLWSGFLADLKSLKATQHWLDIGAGEGQAIRDYYADPEFAEKARVTALSVQPPNSANLAALKSASPGFQSLTGRLLENYSVDEIPRADVISDVMGALHYSHELDVTLAKELELLKVGGRLYTQVPDGTRFFFGGREISWSQFLKRVEGIRLVRIPGDDADFPSYAIERVAEKIAVPRLKLVKFKAGEPPTRTFQVL